MKATFGKVAFLSIMYYKWLTLHPMPHFMLTIVKQFITVLPIFLLIDLTWLGFVMAKFYNTQLGDLARRSGESLAPHWPSALLVYLAIPAGIVLFVLPRVTGHLDALMFGALFGLILYATYDLTNYSTLANWPIQLVIVDIVWGAVLCGLVALIASFIPFAK